MLKKRAKNHVKEQFTVITIPINKNDLAMSVIIVIVVNLAYITKPKKSACRISNLLMKKLKCSCLI